MAKHLVFIIEEEESTRALIQQKLQKNWGFEINAFSSGEAALNALQAYPDVVLLDVAMLKSGGTGILSELKLGRPDLPIIILATHEDMEHGLAALSAGALDVLLMPLDADRLHIALLNAVAVLQIEREGARLRERLEQRVASERLIADSREMQLVQRLIDKLRGKDVPVLLTGERGSGQELVAQAIHFHGDRSHGPFIEVHCTSVPPDELESLLFGKEGNGMEQRRIGAFEEANGGTLFLDEVGDLDLRLQENVLGVIQKKMMRRIGGTDDIRTNVRIVAASTRNLKEATKTKRFRDDLYYILASYPIHLPPLRERGADIIRLAEHYLNLCCQEQKTKPRGFSREVIEAMYHYPWPGNVHELESAIRHAAIHSGGEMISLRDLPAAAQPFKNASMELETEGKLFHDNKIVSLDKIKEQAVRRAIEISRGNLAQTSRELEISRSTLYKLIDKYRLKI